MNALPQENSAPSDDHANTALKTLESKGHCPLPGVVECSLAEAVHQELREANDATIAEATKKGIPSVLDLDLPGKYPKTDALLEQLLTAPATQDLLTQALGAKFRIRDINARLMTGVDDPAKNNIPPHELHVDTHGEFCLVIALSEASGRDMSATTFVDGTHCSHIDPRYDFALGAPYYHGKYGKMGLPFMYKNTAKGNQLAEQLFEKRTSYDVAPGDAYFFFNSTWHGRDPNKEGAKGAFILIGGFIDGHAHVSGWDNTMKQAHRANMSPSLITQLKEGFNTGFDENKKPLITITFDKNRYTASQLEQEAIDEKSACDKRSRIALKIIENDYYSYRTLASAMRKIIRRLRSPR